MLPQLHQPQPLHCPVVFLKYEPNRYMTQAVIINIMIINFNLLYNMIISTFIIYIITFLTASMHNVRYVKLMMVQYIHYPYPAQFHFLRKNRHFGLGHPL